MLGGNLDAVIGGSLLLAAQNKSGFDSVEPERVRVSKTLRGLQKN
jgi:hypothetical protein